MVFVALAMVAIIGMAALSIDVITLYLAKQDAQRAADAAALAAAKIISVSGITGDPGNVTGNWAVICDTNGLATRVAKAVANQNLIGGPVITPTVRYGPTLNPDCSALNTTGFGVNPIVTVELTRNNLPTFFSRIWGNRANNISATATAEVFNPSNSGNSGNQVTGTLIPVQPRCVKPWVVPNQDPLHPGGIPRCNQGGGPCQKFVELTDGSISNPGISLNGGGATGIIGETFWLVPNCDESNPATCLMRKTPIPMANYNPTPSNPFVPGMPNLLYLPGQVSTTPVGVPSCATADEFEEAIGGCDAPDNYTCGLAPGSGGTNVVDLSRNPEIPTTNAVSCLIHQAPGGDVTAPTGQDYVSSPTMGQPNSYPFQIFAGSSNPLLNPGPGGAALSSGSPISVSSSIVSLPIYNHADPGVVLQNGNSTNVMFVGFLQVFINAVDPNGNINVTVLNVAGCGRGVETPVGTAVTANSPVPVRLVTSP
jgi:hypothetical protein